VPLVAGEVDELVEAEVRDLEADEENQYALWIFQLLLAAPFQMILLIQLTLLIFGTLQHTLADGSSSLMVYLIIGVLSFFTLLPLAPFVHKLHRFLFIFGLLVFVASAAINIFAFPFSQYSPLKIYFRQTLDLDTGRNEVILVGVTPFLHDSIIPQLPSATGKDVSCRSGVKYPELKECSWDGHIPAIAPGSPQDWLKVNTSLIRPGYGRITIQGSDTRVCKIYFNSTINNIHVNGSPDEFLKHYGMPSNGLTALNLYSRTFEREFQVEFGWDGDNHFKGRVGCTWDELIPGRIPAFDEALAFLPTWATVSKYQSGLVEVTQSFTI